MSDIDRLIAEALSEQEQDIISSTEEQGWFALGIGLFKGKLGWVTWVIMIAQAELFIAGVWCAYHFFNAVEVLPALKWGISGAVLILAAAMLKFSLMPQLQADRILRELKRVELLVLHSGSKP